MSKIVVIGAGFSGLSAAACLSRAGHDVTVVEKNNSVGGRARKFEEQGFVFDMGPSWYWMPDVFEKFYHRFGKTTADFYSLERLDPSYRVFFSSNDIMDVPAGEQALYELFESREPGSSNRLKIFLEEARYKYETGMNQLVHKPGQSIFEWLDPKILGGLFKLDIFSSLSSHVRKHFKNPELIQLLEFPVLFLGASPANTPALYSLMNYADMKLGTWYPMGGMNKIAEAMMDIAKANGAQFKFDHEVSAMEMNGAKIKALQTNQASIPSDYVVASADYHFVEQKLLPPAYRKYSEEYWQSRVMAPSSLIFYLGINKRVKNLLHHNLFFDTDFKAHAEEIYEHPVWPKNPQFYACCPSVTDPSVAPAGCENIFVLIPVASGLVDHDSIREIYFKMIMNRLEHLTGESLRDHVVFKQSYAHRDFASDYHAFRGNAYGLANTLKQTANFKPSILNKKVNNLFYTGQLTVPGPGIPPAIISGQVVSDVLMKHIERKIYRNRIKW